MADIAKREGTTQRYIAHILKLAFLAPDIMEAIIRGRIPADLTLTRLKKGFSHRLGSAKTSLRLHTLLNPVSEPAKSTKRESSDIL